MTELDLQRASAPADWDGVVEEPVGPSTPAVGLAIDTPDYAQVRTLCNRDTGVKRIEIEGITLNDLVTLRDSISLQIDMLRAQMSEADRWEPI